MIIYGTNNNNKFYNKQILKSENELLNKEYDFLNLKLKIRFDYFDCKNYNNQNNIFCVYIGQPYYKNKKIEALRILKLFKNVGVSLFNKLSGAFALIIYNYKKNELIIYRSILFMDSIFYSLENGREFEFSNLLDKLDINDYNNISRKYINEYLSLPLNSYIQSTPFKNINRIRPGEYIKVNLNNNKLLKKYIKKIYYSSKITKLNESTCANYYYKIFEQSIKDLLYSSNKKIKIYASGGLDSSAIIYMIYKVIEEKNLNKDVTLLHKKFKNDGFENIYLEELNKSTKFKIEYEEIGENTIFRNINIFQKIKVFEPSLELLSFTENNTKNYKDNLTIFSGYGGDQLLYSNLIDEKDNFFEKIMAFINSKQIVKNKLNFICCQHIKDRIINYNYLEKYDIIKNRNKKLLLFGHKNPYKTVKFANYYLMFPYNNSISGDIKYPYCDERLVNFCFNMNHKYYCQDLSKYIFRKAFDGKLPKSIIERKDKTATYNTFNLTLKKYENKVWSIFENSVLVKENIFDKEKYRASIYRFINASMTDFIGFLNILALDYWLILRYNLGGKICD